MSTTTTFDLSTTKPAPTVTLPLYHPETGAVLPVTATCAGFYSAAERAASHALADAEAEAEGKPTDTAAAHARYTAFVTAILLDIPGGEIDGAPIVITSPADAARVLAALPWIVEQVFSAYVGQLAFFGRRRPS
jgi:hypothetical protein